MIYRFSLLVRFVDTLIGIGNGTRGWPNAEWVLSYISSRYFLQVKTAVGFQKDELDLNQWQPSELQH
jgi:hypothetical protein